MCVCVSYGRENTKETEHAGSLPTVLVVTTYAAKPMRERNNFDFQLVCA